MCRWESKCGDGVLDITPNVSIYLSTYLPTYLSIYLSDSLTVCLSICVSFKKWCNHREKTVSPCITLLVQQPNPSNTKKKWCCLETSASVPYTGANPNHPACSRVFPGNEFQGRRSRNWTGLSVTPIQWFDCWMLQKSTFHLVSKLLMTSWNHLIYGSQFYPSKLQPTISGWVDFWITANMPQNASNSQVFFGAFQLYSNNLMTWQFTRRMTLRNSSQPETNGIPKSKGSSSVI